MSMKRVYKTVEVRTADGGFGIFLDGRSLSTPARRRLAVPSRGLADAIAAEWDAQIDEIRPTTMPLTRLAATAIDRVRDQRGHAVGEIAAYGETDLLCHLAPGPEELVRRQREQWQPLLDWFALRYDATLLVTQGVMPQRQPPDALKAVRAAVEAVDDMELPALHVVVAACGSVVLGLALAEGRLHAKSAFELSQLDESWQIEHWGEDEQAMLRRRGLWDDIVAAERYLRLCRG